MCSIHMASMLAHYRVSWWVQVIRAITPLIRKLGPKANPGNLKLIPKAAVAAWAFYAGMPAAPYR